MKNKDISALLGKDTVFEGKLNFHGTIRIDGHFKGEISANGGNLIVGEEGMIEADVHISYIVVSGEIHGNIIADQKVDIYPSGKVFGDIQTPILKIQEGSIFEGKSHILQTKETGERKSAVKSSDQPIEEPPLSLGTIHGIVSAYPPRPDGPLHDIITAMENKREGEPIKKAKVFAVCQGVGKKKTKTDDSGYYEFTDLEDGVWKLKVKARGYELVESTVEISGGGVYEMNFE